MRFWWEEPEMLAEMEERRRNRFCPHDKPTRGNCCFVWCWNYVRNFD